MAGNELNALELLKDGLKRTIIDSLGSKLEEEMIEDFRNKIRPEIQRKLEGLVIDGIDSFKDCRAMRDEVHAYVHWDGEKSESPIREMSKK